MVQATETVKLILRAGRPLDRPVAALRRTRDVVPGNEGSEEPAMSDLRPECDDPRADRLSGVLRTSCRSRIEQPTTAPAATTKSVRSSSRRFCEQGSETVILDVRNPEEIAICRIAGSTVIPLPELADRLSELDQAASFVVHCKSGVRSAKAIGIMQAAGFSRLKNLTGGILAWIKDVDPSLPTY